MILMSGFAQSFCTQKSMEMEEGWDISYPCFRTMEAYFISYCSLFLLSLGVLCRKNDDAVEDACGVSSSKAGKQPAPWNFEAS